MKKAFDQTVRDIKREVNKTVLKIPKIEQKVLDGTSNEPWGPHGSLLADIAQATRNHHEYQMIMAVLWKRINDTGKNWRHVYKGLTVLEYLVAHGSERVIDDIKEHAYQISTLSNFQYIDSSGRDQGNNVRKKSQNLVSLVNDKERIIEVRQKAASNRDKFRNTSSMGGMYRPNSYSSMGGYDDRSEGRYGSRDMDRNVDFYGREKEYGNRDDDRYGRSGEGRDVDRYDRDHGEHYSRDSYRDDDYRGRSRSVDDYQYGSRSRSSDRNGQHTFDDDGQFPSRNSGARPDEQSQDGSITRRLERKFSEQNISAPPSYEEAVGESGNTVQSQRDVETSAPTPTRSFPPPVSSTPRQPTHGTTGSPPNQKVYGFDEFDPRGSASAAPTASNSAQTNVQDSLAIVPVALATSTTDSELHIQSNSGAIPTFGTSEAAASYTPTQTFDDPFGDSPFKAISSSNVKGQPHASQTDPSQSTINHSPVMPSAGFETSAIVPSFHHGESFSTANYSTSGIIVHSQTNSYHSNEESLEHQNINVLADLLPPPGSLSPVVPQPAFTTLNGPSAQPNFPALPGFPAQQNINNFGNFQQDIGNMGPTDFQNPTGPGIPFSILQEGSSAHVNSYMAPPNAGLPTQPINAGSSQDGYVAPHSSRVTHQTVTGPPGQPASGNFNQPQSSAVLKASQAPYQSPDFPTVKSNHDVGSFLPEAVSITSTASQQFQPASGSLSTVSQTSKNNFETKSTVWADTLSRGLVNLNISGPKTNPLADIGVDFDSLNRKEKRMEKPSTAPVVSTVNMGKAMGSGTGMGRAGASALRPPPGGMLGSGMGMGANPSVGMGMRGYGGMNQPMGGMGMNMGMGQRFQMQPPGTNLPGVYNPMMGAGSYAPQRPPYGGYR